MRIINCEQRSAEWYHAITGSLGASQVHDSMSRLKSGPKKGERSFESKTVMGRLAVERLTGTLQDSYVSKPMQDGIDREPAARAAYSFYADTDVEQVGLVLHPSIDWTHASPDGLAGDDGLVEIKCPTGPTHLDVLLSKTVPEKYVTQIMWQLACTGRAWCDFVSYDPNFPEDLCLWIKRVERDDERIAKLEDMVREFLAELDEKLAAIQALREAA